MKNDYKVLGDTTIIYLTRRNGETLETLISTSDLPRAKEIPNRWSPRWDKSTKAFYVTCSTTNEAGKKTTIQLHRFIMDAPKDKVVDHVNHRTLDNTRTNLRLATKAENTQNKRGLAKNSTSGIRGVYWSKDHKKWRAQIGVKGKNLFLGYFDDLEEAGKAAAEARKQHMPYATN